MCTAGRRGLSCKKLRSGSSCQTWPGPEFSQLRGTREGRDTGPLEEKGRPGLEWREEAVPCSGSALKTPLSRHGGQGPRNTQTPPHCQSLPSAATSAQVTGTFVRGSRSWVRLGTLTTKAKTKEKRN